MKQPEALRLADQLKERYGGTVPTSQAAAELRRLHEVNTALVSACKSLASADFGASGWTEEAESAALRIRAALAKAQEDA